MELPVITRSCGECSACCKVLHVDLGDKVKPVNTICSHQVKKKGCDIYQDRPLSCKYFFCAWLQGFFDISDRPDKIGIMVHPGPLVISPALILRPFESNLGPRTINVKEIQPGSRMGQRAQAIIDSLKSDYDIMLTRYDKTAIFYGINRRGQEVALEGKQHGEIDPQTGETNYVFNLFGPQCQLSSTPAND